MDQKLNKFMQLVNEQVVTDEIDITINTPFSKFNSWDSLSIMAMVVMVEDEYQVKVTYEQIEKAKKLEDIFTLISDK
jgi:acyl carrier protein